VRTKNLNYASSKEIRTNGYIQRITERKNKNGLGVERVTGILRVKINHAQFIQESRDELTMGVL